MEGMIQNMELAFRMQTTTPQLVDISKESKETLELYGIGGKDTDKHGRACLLARKLSESGVRFVAGDDGRLGPSRRHSRELPRLCKQTDQPVAGLIKDLKRRGLLERHARPLVRRIRPTPWSQDLSGTAPMIRTAASISRKASVPG